MGDWEIAEEAGALLLRGHFDVYTLMPTAQMGPLALLMAGLLPSPVYMLSLCALMAGVLALAVSTPPPSRRLYTVALAAGILLAWPWSAFGIQGHADEALVVLGGVAMVSAYERRWHGAMVAAFLVAIAAKPTAIVLLPMLFLGSQSAAVLALAGMTAIWMPFFLSDPAGFLAAGRGPGEVWPGSIHAMFGVELESAFPRWVRPTQLVGGMALVWALTRFRTPAAALVAVLAFRALLEPGAWNYYGTALAAAGLLLDTRNFRGPWVTALGFVAFAVVLDTPISAAGGHARMAAIVIALTVALTVRSRLISPDGSSWPQRTRRGAQTGDRVRV